MNDRFARRTLPLAFAGLTVLLSHVASAEPPAAPPTASVNTYHYAYDPNPITVAAGTNVTFKNSDEIAHTVTSRDGGDKPAFDSGDMPQNATWSHVFAKAGTYKYYCTYHSYMSGTIVVK